MASLGSTTGWSTGVSVRTPGVGRSGLRVAPGSGRRALGGGFERRSVGSAAGVDLGRGSAGFGLGDTAVGLQSVAELATREPALGQGAGRDAADRPAVVGAGPERDA